MAHRASDADSTIKLCAKTYTAPVSPRKRLEGQSSPPHDVITVPTIKPDEDYIEEVASMLNYCSQYMDPSEVMSADFLNEHVIVVDLTSRYPVYGPRLEQEARAAGLLSIDFECRMGFPKDFKPYDDVPHRRPALPILGGNKTKELVYMIIGTYRTAFIFKVGEIYSMGTPPEEGIPWQLRSFIKHGAGVEFLVVGAGISIHDSVHMTLLGIGVRDDLMLNTHILNTRREEDVLLNKPGMAKQQLVCYGSHCKDLPEHQLIAYNEERKEWCRQRNIPLDDEEFLEYQLGWWRTHRIYTWIEGAGGEIRTVQKNYMYFDAKTPIDYALRFFLEQPWAREVSTPRQLVKMLMLSTRFRPPVPFGQIPRNLPEFPYKGYPVPLIVSRDPALLAQGPPPGVQALPATASRQEIRQHLRAQREQAAQPNVETIDLFEPMEVATEPRVTEGILVDLTEPTTPAPISEQEAEELLAEPSTGSTRRKLDRRPIIIPPTPEVSTDVSDAVYARIIHPRMNAKTQFAQAYRAVPMMREVCNRCGMTDQHQRPECTNSFRRCTWAACPNKDDHAFYVCPIFVRRCQAPGCYLRGHRTDEHNFVMDAYQDRLNDYVREWEQCADEHLYARARRLYAPWGCYRMPQELDHLSLNHVYFYGVPEWNGIVNNLMHCRDILKDRTWVIPDAARRSFMDEEGRRNKRLRQALRSSIEEQILGRPMTSQEKSHFVNKYRLEPVNDPRVLEQLLLYLRLVEENQRQSLYAPLLEYERRQREVPRPFPPWFDPSKPRTVQMTDPVLKRIHNFCAECNHRVDKELCPRGYCFACADERDPPPSEEELKKKRINFEPVERDLANRLQGFGQPGSKIERTEAPAGLRRQVAIGENILDTTFRPPAMMPDLALPRDLTMREGRTGRYEFRPTEESERSRSRSPPSRSPVATMTKDRTGARWVRPPYRHDLHPDIRLRDPGWERERLPTYGEVQEKRQRRESIASSTVSTASTPRRPVQERLGRPFNYTPPALSDRTREIMEARDSFEEESQYTDLERQLLRLSGTTARPSAPRRSEAPAPPVSRVPPTPRVETQQYPELPRTWPRYADEETRPRTPVREEVGQPTTSKPQLQFLDEDYIELEIDPEEYGNWQHLHEPDSDEEYDRNNPTSSRLVLPDEIRASRVARGASATKGKGKGQGKRSKRN